MEAALLNVATVITRVLRQDEPDEVPPPFRNSALLPRAWRPVEPALPTPKIGSLHGDAHLSIVPKRVLKLNFQRQGFGMSFGTAVPGRTLLGIHDRFTVP